MTAINLAAICRHDNEEALILWTIPINGPERVIGGAPRSFEKLPKPPLLAAL